MKSIQQFQPKGIKIILTDIDGTLTNSKGQIPSEVFKAMEALNTKGYLIVPVTGRPAGWCEMIARTWPVHGVIGENGALAFSIQNGQMKRFFHPSVQISTLKQQKSTDASIPNQYQNILNEIKQQVPRAKVSSDQFCRMFDLAIDFAEDVHPALSDSEVHLIQKIFEQHGAVAKISNIHVNGWFGEFTKVQMTKWLLENSDFFLTGNKLSDCVFIGDSPNDEPMFEFVPESVGVRNIEKYVATLKSPPKYMTDATEYEGFLELAQSLT